jgi:hypothetical protein
MRSSGTSQRVNAAIARGLTPGTLGIFDLETLKLVVEDGSGLSCITDPHTTSDQSRYEQTELDEDNGLISVDTVKDVGSYSWLAEQDTPTMIVPGEQKCFRLQYWACLNTVYISITSYFTTFHCALLSSFRFSRYHTIFLLRTIGG